MWGGRRGRGYVPINDSQPTLSRGDDDSADSETRPLLNPSSHGNLQRRSISYDAMSSQQSTPDVEAICNKGSSSGCPCADREGQESKTCCTTRKCKKRVMEFFPFLNWAPCYSLADLQGDAIAGITVALTVIPQGLAYATVATLPPQYGLYSAFMGCFIYVFFGTAKDITFGPTAIMSLMVAQYTKGSPAVAVTMTLLAGLIQLVMGLLNLGFVLDFISFPVINGFTSAAAITIATTQIKSLLGLKDIPNKFFLAIKGVVLKITSTNLYDMAVGLVSIVILYVLKCIRGLNWTEVSIKPLAVSLPICSRIVRRMVWLLCTARNAIVVLLSTIVCFVLVSKNIKVLTQTQNVEAGLPPFNVPHFYVVIGTEVNGTIVNGTTVNALETVGTGYVVVALVGILESIAIGKAFARLSQYRIQPSQEMVAMGLANAVSSFFSSYPITGSFSRTAVNHQTGVRTPLGGAFTGTVVLCALGFLAPVFKYIPKAALAAVIISSVIPMFDYAILPKFWKVNKLDLLPWTFTFFGCLFINLESGILIGIGISILPLLWLMARPPFKSLENNSNDNSRFAVLTPKFGIAFPSAEDFSDRANDLAIVEGEDREEDTDDDAEPNLSLHGRQSKRWLSQNRVKKKVRRRHLIVDGSQVLMLDFGVIQMLSELSTTQQREGRLLVFCNFDSTGYLKLSQGIIEPFHYCIDIPHAVKFISKKETEDGNAHIPLNFENSGGLEEVLDDSIRPSRHV